MKKHFYAMLFPLVLCLSLLGCSHKPSKQETTAADRQTAKTPEPAAATSSPDSSPSLPPRQGIGSPQEGNPKITGNPVSTEVPAKTPQTTKITISAAGDCTFGSDQSSPASVNFYSVYNKKKNDAYFFQKVKKYFEKDDLTLVNLEGTLTKNGTRMDKTYAFRGNPSYVNILKKGSVEAVSFANNHCKDYGEISYTDTINTLKKAGIKYSSYEKTSIYRTKKKKIGMVAVNGLSGADYSKSLIDSGIKNLKKKKADLIIVSMHAGIEHTSSLNNTQTQLAHYAVEKGANLVLGHHPHTLQGVEKYKGAYIVYSLANFCFGGNTNPSDKDTIIFQQTFTFQGNKLQKNTAARIIPCRVSSTTAINNYQPTPLSGAGRRHIIQKMNSFSKPLGVHFQKDGKVQN